MSERRSNCPIACALDLVGDRWTLLVLRDLFLGARYFDDFRSSSEGVATNILGDRLRKLEQAGLVSRTPEPNDKRRVRYELTVRGRSVDKVLLAMRRWGLENIDGTVSRPLHVVRSE
ncbi:MAG: putative transcriptional regulator [Myxococcaceae bacterium]|nr:putative transcriptional regulator [Myxococcaceae bacterium]